MPIDRIVVGELESFPIVAKRDPTTSCLSSGVSLHAVGNQPVAIQRVDLPFSKSIEAMAFNPEAQTNNRLPARSIAMPDGITPRNVASFGSGVSLIVSWSSIELVSKICTVSLFALLTNKRLWWTRIHVRCLADHDPRIAHAYEILAVGAGDRIP